MARRPKISVIGGGGNVGASVALWAGAKELGDVVAVDIPKAEGVVKGRMLDLLEAMPIERSDSKITGTTDYTDIADSDVVAVTAGLPRKPGMSRDDLIATNVQIVKDVCTNVARHAPQAIVIVVSNPLDAMVYTAWKTTGFPPHRIVGQAGALDIARFKTFIAEETGFSVEDVNALLLGGHGDDMVPLPRFTNIAGIPVTQFISQQRLEELVERTKKGGGEIVQLMDTSAYYAPAAGVVQMIEASVKDKQRIIPGASYCEGQFGINGLFVGVPTLLGANGVERVIDLDLESDEKQALQGSADHVQQLVDKVRELDSDLA
jgi:malate dehydrogenase